MSSTTLSVNDNNGIAVLELHSKPVNVFTWDFMTDLKQQFANIETNPKIRALIITSSLKCFIAGADINEFYSRKRVKDYNKISEDFCLALYRLPIPTIVAINGHSYGLGCAIANVCDYRFIVKSAMFGLSETQIGITITYLEYLTTQILGHKLGTRVCIEGKVLSASEAFNIGWIDGIADDVNHLMSIANTKAEQLIKIPASAYASIKKMSQLEFEDNYAKYGDKQMNEFTENACSDSTNIILGDLLKSLSQKKSK